MAHERQHWIPKAYLSAWCDRDPATQNPPRIYRYLKSGSYKDYRSPKQVFADPDLYTVPDPDGGRNLGTEHALGRLEDAYARTRDRVLAKRNPIIGDARRDILLFIAALRVRSSTMRDQRAASDLAALRIADDMNASLLTITSERRRTLPQKFSSNPESGSIPLKEFRRLASRPFGETLPRDVVAEARILDQMHISILMVPNEGETLITSDAPVVWWDPTDPPPSRRPLGLGRPAIEVTVPLSPTICALVTHQPDSDYVDISAVTVDEINMRTLYRCRDIFLSEKSSLKVNWLAEQDAPWRCHDVT